MARVVVRFFDDETVEGTARDLDFDEPDFLVEVDDAGGLENNETAWIPLTAVKWVELQRDKELADTPTRKVAIRSWMARSCAVISTARWNVIATASCSTCTPSTATARSGSWEFRSPRSRLSSSSASSTRVAKRPAPRRTLTSQGGPWRRCSTCSRRWTCSRGSTATAFSPTTS